MFIDLVAVLDDGARPWAGWVPARPRRALAITRGEDVTFKIDLVNPLGSPVDLDIGGADSMVLTARTPFERGVRGARKIVERSAAKAAARGRGKYDLVVPGLDTRFLPAMALAWDVQVTRPTGHSVVVYPGRWLLGDSMAAPTGTPPAPTVPGDLAATQDQRERSFVWTWSATGPSDVVTIPGTGMRDASFIAEAEVCALPFAEAPTADLESDPAFQTQTTLILQCSAGGALVAGTTVNLFLRDRA